MNTLTKIFISTIYLIAILFQIPADAQTESKKYKVIVIGAGISGMSAAKKLTDNHVPVLVLEARNRIGGRIQTIYPWGVALDLGAAWIHGTDNNPLTRIANSLNLRTITTDYNDGALAQKFRSFALYQPDAKRITENSLQKAAVLIEKFINSVDDNPDNLDGISIQTAFNHYIKNIPMNADEKSLFLYLFKNAYLFEFATDLKNLAANADTVYESSSVSGENALLKTGYNQLFEHLINNVAIRFNQQVIRVTYLKNGVDIDTTDNHYHADRVIITVPLGVLKSGSISFTPALPLSKQKAINNLGMSIYNKIYLHFEYPFWDIDKEWIGLMPAKDNTIEVWDIMNEYKINHNPILVFFSAGSFAKEVEKWNDKKTLEQTMKVLKKIYGKSIPDATSVVITRWGSDPYSHGSYSYLPVGASIHNYGELAKSINHQLYFAGEATSSSDPATAHGAYLSGIRAAQEVLRDMETNEITHEAGHE